MTHSISALTRWRQDATPSPRQASTPRWARPGRLRRRCAMPSGHPGPTHHAENTHHHEAAAGRRTVSPRTTHGRPRAPRGRSAGQGRVQSGPQIRSEHPSKIQEHRAPPAPAPLTIKERTPGAATFSRHAQRAAGLSTRYAKETTTCGDLTIDRATFVRQGAVDTGPQRYARDTRHSPARSHKNRLTCTNASQGGWPGAGSNRRPSAFQADALAAWTVNHGVRPLPVRGRAGRSLSITSARLAEMRRSAQPEEPDIAQEGQPRWRLVAVPVAVGGVCTRSSRRRSRADRLRGGGRHWVNNDRQTWKACDHIGGERDTATGLISTSLSSVIASFTFVRVGR